MRAVTPHDPTRSYAAVLDALPIVSYVLATDGSVVFLSRAWQKFTGYSTAEGVANQATLVHPDDVERVTEAWSAARERGETSRDEFRLRLADGSYRWVLTQTDAMRADDGTITGWIGTVSDLTDLRRAEEASFASAREAIARSHFAERLLDASDDCVKVLDLDARLVSISENGRRKLKIADFELVRGARWLDFWQGVDRIAAEAAVASARAGGRGRFTGLYAVEGDEKWWDVTVTPLLDHAGQPDQILAVSRDITEIMRAHHELARSEERHRLIGEALPGVVWSATPDGHLDHVTAAPNSNRLPVEARLSDRWLDTIHPDDRERTRDRWQLSIDTGEPYEVQFRARMADGTHRWQLVRAIAQRDASGEITRWVGVNVDIDAQKRADEAREQFVRLVEASDDYISFGDTAGNARYLNAAGLQLVGLESLEAALQTDMWDYFLDEDVPFVKETLLPTLLAEGRWRGELRLRHQTTGAAVPMWHNMFVLHDDAGNVSGMATVSRDLRERYRIDVGLRTLAEAGAAIYGSLDFQSTMRNVADAVVRSFASFCTVDAIDDDGEISSVAASHRDPSLVPIIERAATLRNARSDHPVHRTVRSGDVTLIEELPKDWWDIYGQRDELGEQMDALDMRSVIYVPIRSQQDGTIFGALTCILAGTDPRVTYTTEDVRFAEEVAVRAGLAFDHARAYEREKRIAVTLQGASLPKTLPTIDHLYLSADYRPGKSEATIGGDWYDAFALDDGRVGITVGDVLGNGLGAAVTMGRLRQSMRAVATLLAEPNAMLDAADRTVRAESDEAYATALAGVFDPRTHQFTFASAGHPSPVLRHPDGRIEEFRAPGMMLGLRRGTSLQTITIDVVPGSTLVFFTDGLTEATRDIDEGQRRLHAAMGDERVAHAENPAHELVELVLAGRPATDDIAVLVAEVGPSKRFDKRLRTAAAVAADREPVRIA